MSQHEIIITGVHLDLTDALKQIVHHKVERLFHHTDRIVRVRIELEHHNYKLKQNEFIAKGHIEIQGPDIIISVASDDLYKSVDELVDKLDRKLGRKAGMHKSKRRDTHAIEFPVDIPKIRHA